MNRQDESWETIARALAKRLRYSAGFCDNGHTNHREGVMDSCPSCLDTFAYERYAARAGRPGDDRPDLAGNWFDHVEQGGA